MLILIFLISKQNIMKKKFDLVIGLFALANVIYKLIQCPSCEDHFFFFNVPGFVYILIWTFLAGVLLYGVYKANWGNMEES